MWYLYLEITVNNYLMNLISIHIYRMNSPQHIYRRYLLLDIISRQTFSRYERSNVTLDPL